MRIILAALALVWTCCVASAQTPVLNLMRVVTSCGTVPTPYTVGTNQLSVMDVNGNFCTNATGGGGGGGTGTIGSAVPSTGVYNGVNVSGTLRGWSGLSTGSLFAGTVAIVDASGNQITSFGGSGGTASNFTSAFPSSGTAAGWSDGTNMQGARVFDADTGAGTQYVAGVNLRIAASGGSVEGGTSTNPIRTDPTGSTTQPVSGTVTANAGSGTFAISALSLPLPSGASTSALQSTGNTALTTINTTLGSPFQAGGSIGNSSFGISGTLPAFAAIPAFKIDQTTPGTTNLVALTAETTKVIGTVNQGTSPWVTSATISGTVAVTQSTSPWIVAGGGTAGTAATGVATIQGIASMTPVQVSQATAGNLNATVVGTGTFVTQSAITAASGAYASGSIASGAFASGAVASGAYASGSLASGAMVDLTNLSTPITPTTATATKGVLLGAQYNSTQATFTNGQQGSVQISSRGEAKTNIMDAAGNARGANVNASNQLSVSIDGGSGGTMAVTQSGTWTVQPGNTANSTPWLVTAASATAPVSTMNSASANGGMNSAVAGVFDDAAPTSITENSFGFLRMSANRNAYSTIRDAAGNERGVNVNASNQMSVSIDGTNAVTQSTSPWIVAGGGTAGSAATGVATVQGIASMTPLLVNPGTAANWAVGATGSAIPANAIFNGLSDGTNLRGWLGAANALNSTGTGIGTAQIVGQFDDVAPTSITENQFGNIRMSANRNLYGTIRDAAGNERGANVSAGNALLVDASATTQPVSGTVTVAASENHVGEVGGNSIDITNAMTTSNNSITTGEALGGLQTLTSAVRVSGSVGASGTSGIIQKVIVSFTDAVAGTSGDVYFFNANPTGSTCTDNTAFALAAADRAKVISVAHVTDFTASNTAVIAQANNLAMPFSLSSATSLFACVVARSTWVVTGTTNASLMVTVLRN